MDFVTNIYQAISLMPCRRQCLNLYGIVNKTESIGKQQDKYCQRSDWET